jgi:hypothetical protein
MEGAVLTPPLSSEKKACDQEKERYLECIQRNTQFSPSICQTDLVFLKLCEKVEKIKEIGKKQTWHLK